MPYDHKEKISEIRIKKYFSILGRWLFERVGQVTANKEFFKDGPTVSNG